jgi:hypothetical protein
MTPVTILFSCIDQLKIVVAGVFVVASQTLSFLKRGMDSSTLYLIQHALMAVKAELLFFLSQQFFPVN